MQQFVFFVFGFWLVGKAGDQKFSRLFISTSFFLLFSFFCLGVDWWPQVEKRAFSARTHETLYFLLSCPSNLLSSLSLNQNTSN
jgi:hypothetical protein